MTPRLTVLSVVVVVEQGPATKVVQIAGATDRVTTADAAHALGRSVGQLLGENLAARLQHGEVLGEAA